MLYLHLGCIDVPYVENEPPARQKARLAKNAKRPLAKPKHAASEHKTTGDVATILEAKYGLMEAFFENNEEQIVGDFLATGLKDALENIILGGPPDIEPFAEGSAKIEERFRDFLSTREAETIGIDGTPTAAALKGINHRKKHPYSKDNPRRPSFIDTGLYQASMKAWVSEDQGG